MIYIKKLIVFIFIFLFIGFNLEKSKLIDTFSSKKEVCLLGDIVGIKANTDGVLVLGCEEDITYIDNIKEGDRILYVDDYKINKSVDVSKALNCLKKESVVVTFERNGEIIKKSVKTKKQGENYKLGFWVRDKISGIGTMTCYDFEKEAFYAIGHPICDLDTQKLLKIKQGDIYNLSNLKIIKGSKNNVGQIRGDFDLKNVIGYFQKNSNYGIEGKLLIDSSNITKKNVVQVADFNEVKNGKAQILFKIKDNLIRYYDILITNINQEDKVLEIEIVDEDLLEYTGGIVQGMSGSPIVQNNKLIGALTHVFADDFTKGYGIFIGNILD